MDGHKLNPPSPPETEVNSSVHKGDPKHLGLDSEQADSGPSGRAEVMPELESDAISELLELAHDDSSILLISSHFSGAIVITIAMQSCGAVAKQA